jgi:hypothetical protein
MNHDDIWREKLKIDRDIRREIAKCMDEYDRCIHQHHPTLKQLRDDCGTLGHKFGFKSFGPVGNPWYICEYCGLTKMEDI